MQDGYLNISFILDELSDEKGMSRDHLIAAIKDGIMAAYTKKYPHIEFDITHDKKTDSLMIKSQKAVVQYIYDEEVEITLKKALKIDETAKIDNFIWVPFTGKVGRIEILKAQGVISQKIRDIEAESIYRELLPKQGNIATGTVNKIDKNGINVLLFGFSAFLPKENIIPDEKYNIGNPIKVLIKEVFRAYRPEGQIVLDRVSVDFVKKLMELEIPEIYDGIVSIEKIVRIPGYKTKVLVSSRDMYIDPLGTCIGIGGARIKPILKELNQEKIDIIPVVSKKENEVKEALKPGIIDKVEIIHNKAYVTISQENKPIAIGRGGKNIALASDLIGMPIEIVDNSDNAHYDQE